MNINVKTHRACMFLHCRKRAKERYGISLNRQRWVDISRKIQNGEVIPAGNAENVFIVYMLGRYIKVAFDKKNKCAKTFLTLNQNDT